jgi:hypothetical protein
MADSYSQMQYVSNYFDSGYIGDFYQLVISMDLLTFLIDTLCIF